VIASTAGADKNRLDTGTLGFSDIGNRADYRVEHLGGSFSTGGAVGSQVLGNMASSLLSGLGAGGHAEGVTRAAVSDGTLIVRDQAAQKQDVSTLSHDTAGANGSISPIFDKEKEQKRLQTAQLVGEVAAQAMDVARTEGEIRAITAGKAELAKRNIPEPAAGDTRDAWDAYNEKLQNTSAYRDTQAEWGTGSDIQRGIQAATAAVQGLLAGNVQGAAAGAAAPYLAGLIHKETTSVNGNTQEVNKPANLIAHAVLGAVVAQLQGNNALAGAAGATTGEFIAQQLYPGVEHGKLSEEQKQKISALSTLAAGLAGSLASGDMSGTVAGASAGKNAAENNDMSSGLDGFDTGFWNNVQAQGSLINNTNLTDETGKVLNPATPEEIKYASDKLVKGDLPAGQNAATGLLTAWGAGAATVVAPVLLPATATAGSVIGAGAIGGSANVFNQLNSGESFSATDALIATGISGLTQGKGFLFTEAASVAGAYAGAKLQGKDTLPVVAAAAVGTTLGVAGGKSVEIGNKYFPLVSDKTAGMAGAVGGSLASEIIGSKIEGQLKSAGDDK
jgi:filamentous hemagglutinin